MNHRDPSTLAPAGERPDRCDEAMMHLLHERVPLSLLVDLAETSAPDSRAILDAEGEPTDPWWEPHAS